mgnify:CR=1 FL=1
MDYKKITMEDIRYLIENSHTSYNRYNVEAIYPGIKWPDDYVVDEEQSVKWNKEQVSTHNKEIDKALKKYYQDRHKGYDNFCVDLKQAIQNDYNFTEAQAMVIMVHIYGDGMYKDLEKAEELCEIAYDILNNG